MRYLYIRIFTSSEEIEIRDEELDMPRIKKIENFWVGSFSMTELCMTRECLHWNDRIFLQSIHPDSTVRIR